MVAFFLDRVQWSLIKMETEKLLFRSYKPKVLHLCCMSFNWMALGNNHVTAISTEIFKYVRIHPNFGSRPVGFEKMFLCCFSLKAGRKDLTNRLKVLSPHPPPPPPTPLPDCSFPPEKCWIWIHEIWKPRATWQNLLRFFWHHSVAQRERGVGVDFCACLSSLFSLVLGQKQQEHLFTSQRLASEVWVDSDILENFSRNGSYVVVAQSHSVIEHYFLHVLFESCSILASFCDKPKHDR